MRAGIYDESVPCSGSWSVRLRLAGANYRSPSTTVFRTDEVTVPPLPNHENISACATHHAPKPGRSRAASLQMLLAKFCGRRELWAGV